MSVSYRGDNENEEKFVLNSMKHPSNEDLVNNERITIEGIKKSKFYLKGKKLCNIDYNQIERSVLKRRHRIRSFDRGEEIKDNMIKIVNTEEKKKNIHNLIEKNFKELENNKSERTTKIRNSEQKRKMEILFFMLMSIASYFCDIYFVFMKG